MIAIGLYARFVDLFELVDFVIRFSDSAKNDVREFNVNTTIQNHTDGETQKPRNLSLQLMSYMLPSVGFVQIN